ncbi:MULTISPECIES: O-methyltransferase [Pirellulaceae]|nr:MULTISPECIES: class I SAM-dependent methyltransferase [Pirellulaceae]
MLFDPALSPVAHIAMKPRFGYFHPHFVGRPHMSIRSTILLALIAMFVGFTFDSAYGQRSPGRGFGRDSGDAELEKSPLAANAFEKKALSVLEDVYQNQRFRNVPQHDGRLLRILTQSLGAKHVVELGSSTGYSGIWFGLALKETGGKLTTYEIDAERAATARANYKRAGMEDLITLVEGDAHEEVKKLTGTIDIIFLDADKEGYVDYLNKLLPMLRPNGLVLAHNINPRMADPDFMKAITTNPDLETVVRGGMSITLKKK